MKRKRILALLLTFALAAGMGLNALAAEQATINAGDAAATNSEQNVAYGGDGTSVTIPALLRLPTIDVTVDKPATVLINPYKIEFTNGDLTIDGASSYESSAESVINIPTKITNNSDVKVKVSATGNVTSASMTDDVTKSDKTLFLADSDTFSGTYPATMKKLFLELKMKAQDNATPLTASDLKGAAGSPLVMKGGSKSATAVEIFLADKTATGTNIGSFMLVGRAENAADLSAWGSSDKLDLNIIFDITGQLPTP